MSIQNNQMLQDGIDKKKKSIKELIKFMKLKNIN